MTHGTIGNPAEPDQDDEAVRRKQEERLREVWAAPKGWRYWSAVNNTEVGVWYTAAAFGFMLFAGVLALMMRVQLAVPDNDFLTATFYNQVFTLHGTAMMFLFAVPIFEAVAIILLPQMLGARDLPFPRLSAFGFWCFLIGGVFVCGSIFFGAAPASGWFMYPPLTTNEQYTPGYGPDIWLLGLSFIEVASIAAAVELIVGTLKCRPPGMRLNLMPLYAWYVLVVAGMILFAFPPLIAGDILFELERMFDWPFFDPSRGGDPLLWQHLFWIFGHPEVYIVFLPAIALVAMIVPTFAQRPILGYSWIVLAAVGTGFISFGLWVHHMYTTGLPSISLGFFSAASEAVAIPTGVQIFVFLATLLTGQVIYSVPMLFVSGALATFVIGGLTGVMVALVPFDWQAHDTYFIVAHLHYVLIGGMVFPLVGAFYYWSPHFTGRMMSERLGRWAFWLMFTGFHITFFLMHLTGLRGMPRRVATYPEGLGWDRLNLLSTLGSYILAAGVLVFVWDFLRHRMSGPLAPRDPWGAGTLEWLYPPIAPGHNFHAIPRVHSREPLWDQPELLREHAHLAEGVLRGASHGMRETVGCHPVTGEPLQIVRLPKPTWVPLWAAATIAVAAVATLASAYVIAGAALVAMLVCFALWAWEPSQTGETVDTGPEGVLPVNVADRLGHTHIATIGTLLVLAALYGSLLFSVLYLWNVHPDFTTIAGLADPLWAAVAGGLALVLIASSKVAAHKGPRLGLDVPVLLSAVATGAGLFVAMLQIDPRDTAVAATLWVMAGFVGVMLFVMAFWSLFLAVRKLFGQVAPHHRVPDLNRGSFGLATGVMALIAVVVLLAPHIEGLS